MTNHLMKAAIGGAALIVASPALAGDPVPGVDVLLEQIPGGSQFNGSVDDQGRVTFPNVPVGNYRITFTKKAEAQPPQLQALSRRLTGRELEQLARRGLSGAVLGQAQPVPDGTRAGTPVPQPPAVAPAAPAQLSLCSQATPSGAAYKTGAAPCPPVSGFSQYGGVTEIMIDPAKLEQGAICGEISVTSAGTLALAAVSTPQRGPLAAESLNSTRSNNGGVVDSADEDAVAGDAARD